VPVRTKRRAPYLDAAVPVRLPVTMRRRAWVCQVGHGYRGVGHEVAGVLLRSGRGVLSGSDRCGRSSDSGEEMRD
jgi:hypothetical protein